MAHPVLTALETGQDILFSAARQAGKPDSRKIHISEANGRIIAEDVISSYDLPPAPQALLTGLPSAQRDMQIIRTPNSGLSAQPVQATPLQASLMKMKPCASIQVR